MVVSYFGRPGVGDHRSTVTSVIERMKNHTRNFHMSWHWYRWLHFAYDFREGPHAVTTYFVGRLNALTFVVQLQLDHL